MSFLEKIRQPSWIFHLLRSIAVNSVPLAIDSLIRIFPKGSPNLNQKKVLIVRPDSLGDFIIWLDAAKEMRKVYPPGEFQITLLTNNKFADLAEALPHWDKVVSLDQYRFRTSLKYRMGFLHQIRREGFLICIHPVFSRHLLVGDAIVRTCGAEQRIGWELYENLHASTRFKLRRLISNKWYTRLISLDDPNSMELGKNAIFARELGVRGFQADIPRLPLPEVWRQRQMKKEYFVVVPDAGWEGREWPLTNFLKIAHQIQMEKGWKLVLLGAKKLGTQGDQVLVQTDHIDLTGQTTLKDYIGWLANANLVVANESSAIHLGAALGRRIFCIAGGGHWGRFIPYRPEVQSPRAHKIEVINKSMDCYGCGWLCRFAREKGHPVRCVEEISAEYAWEKIGVKLKNVLS